MDGTPLDFLGSAQPAFLFFLHLVQITAIIVLLRFLDFYEREPYSTILAMFVWGALGATFISLFGNAFVDSLLPGAVGALYGAAISAPLVEEGAKGAALLAAFLASQWWGRRHGNYGFQGVTDGVVYGVAVGMGFAFTENLVYFTNFALESGGDVLGSAVEVFLYRVDFTGFNVLGHGLYTGLFGAGLGMATWKRGVAAKLVWSFGGLLAAMAGHAWWNGFAVAYAVRSYGFDYMAGVFTGQIGVTPAEEEAVIATLDQGQSITEGVYLVMLALLAVGFVLWLRRERQIIRYELTEEVAYGLLTTSELDLLLGAWRRTKSYLDLFWWGRHAQRVALAGLHERLVAFALAKWRIRQLGGDLNTIARDRAEIAAMRAYTSALEQIHGPVEPPPQRPAADESHPPPLMTQN